MQTRQLSKFFYFQISREIIKFNTNKSETSILFLLYFMTFLFLFYDKNQLEIFSNLFYFPLLGFFKYIFFNRPLFFKIFITVLEKKLRE